MKKIMVVMGSDSDWIIMKQACILFQEFNVQFEARVVSAHRTPEMLAPFCRESEAEGIFAIIAGAGGAAHLPGMVASFTYLPVIGVPIKGSSLDGIDSLYSIVQMPKGVPVATMGINNSTNAALFCLRLLAHQDEGIKQKLTDYILNQKNESLGKTRNLII
jgi:phosphoribosylaminoimidazole carboxylase PurE protein